MGRTFADLEIDIQRERVSFRLDENDYADPHKLDDDLVEELAAIRSTGRASDYGSLLLKSTFVGKAFEGYRRIQSAINEATYLRVRLNIDPVVSRLHTLRWECMQDFEPPVRRLGCSPFTPLSRYLPLDNTRTSVKEQTLRVLVAIASPRDLGEGKWSGFTPLNKETEWEAIDKSLSYFGDRVQFELQTTPASFNAIRDRLSNERFHVLHLIGHGGYRRDDPQRPEQGYLLLERPDDELAVPITENLMADLVMDLPSLQLVILAACHSADRSDADAFIGLAPSMIRSGVPAVVAMQELVSFETARKFAERFYHSLGFESLGRVDVAINHARESLYFVNPDADWDWSIPVLFMRGDGQLFEPADSQPPPEVRPPVLTRAQGMAEQGSIQFDSNSDAEIIPLGASIRSLDEQIPEPRSKASAETDRPAVRLFDLMNRHRFSEGELAEVCFRIDVDFEFAPERSYIENVRRLVRYCEKNDKLPALAGEIQRRVLNAASLIDVG